MFSIFFPYDKR